MAANPAREWQARPRLATKNLAPLMDSGTHGVCGPNVPSHAVEVRSKHASLLIADLAHPLCTSTVSDKL